MTAQLRDANYKVVAEQELVTDRFGKCSTTFVLPKGLRNGNFTVRLNNSSENIRVEEYKRPTFELSFSEYKETYQAGDTITVQGKAVSYAGVPCTGGKSEIYRPPSHSLLVDELFMVLECGLLWLQD